ncbi:hypothetical protein [Caulobacter sp. RL271]|jgi:hypothetical protein|uniref:Tripartite tricarboxylate transporter TctB family protein n=1 Tax=Caulobacter segnis TaxID=88688 RepID=A0ABY4ZU62_9CAUL|nr:hypothetical protein [Caulobacter segnis]USQ96243.1 hypothetical protein MZV50_01165 [Caulobacter segnis]
MTMTFLYRLGGLACLAIGVFMGWIAILKPLQAAQSHAPVVDYDVKAFAFVPMMLVFGLFFLIGGDRWPYRDVERKTLTPAGWALMAVIALAGLAGFLLFKQQFTALGYAAG